MSITEELCSWAHVNKDDTRIDTGLYGYDRLIRIADRIDEALADYIQLPKDADGETIRVGEELVSYKMGHEHFVVDGVGWHDGTGVVFHTAGNCLNGWNRFNAELCHHVQPDSWERIIEDATALGAQMKRRTHQIGDFVERCKRLAGDA